LPCFSAAHAFTLLIGFVQKQGKDSKFLVISNHNSQQIRIFAKDFA
jgi:hypothetical protein